jgi:YD repeat-containing protein
VYKVNDRVYNNVNLLQKESLPYFDSGSTKTSATTTSALFTSYTYDPLQRLLITTNAVGSSSNAYGNWLVTTTDPRGKTKDAHSDAYGNLIEVDEHNNSSTYTTTYTFNGLKALTNITDALGNVRNFTYDGLGRRLTAQDLHATADMTYGSSTFAYDDAGNLTQAVDAKSQTINYTYDSLNRPLTEDYTGQAGTEFQYTYDTCTQGKTRLCVVSSTDAITSSTYNSLGQLTQESKTIGGSVYVTSYTYDRQGNQVSITNPDNSQITYLYNGAGFVESVSEKENGGNTNSVITNFDYSPTDQPATIAYANGVTVTNTYDPTKIYRLTQKVGALPSGGGNAQNMSYAYDALGNITQLVDASNSGTGKTVNYTYDDLSRLTNASTTSASSTPYGQTFVYDALGNITVGPAGT